MGQGFRTSSAGAIRRRVQESFTGRVWVDLNLDLIDTQVHPFSIQCKIPHGTSDKAFVIVHSCQHNRYRTPLETRVITVEGSNSLIKVRNPQFYEQYSYVNLLLPHSSRGRHNIHRMTIY